MAGSGDDARAAADQQQRPDEATRPPLPDQRGILLRIVGGVSSAGA